MTSPENYRTAPAPDPRLRREEYGAVDKKEARLGIRFAALSLIGAVTLTSAGWTAGSAIGKQTVMDDINAETYNSDSQQDVSVTELAQDITGDSSLSVDCSTKERVASADGSHSDADRLAYVQVFTIDDTPYVPPNITMQRAYCQDLLTFPRMDGQPMGDESFTYTVRAREFSKAAGILLHEVEHIKLVLDEGEATCYAVQKLPAALEDYFPSPEQAHHYAAEAAIAISQTFDPTYISNECRPGGAYDLGISTVYTSYNLRAGSK